MKADAGWPTNLGNPGSTHAQGLGCTCSPVLNYYGRGDESGLHKIAPACPLHAAHVVPAEGIRCGRCGAVLEVIREVHALQLRTVCPNGCTPKEIDHPTALHANGRAPRAPAPPSPATPVICARCQLPVPPSGKRGAPRRIHEECLTTAERVARDRVRDIRDGRKGA